VINLDFSKDNSRFLSSVCKGGKLIIHDQFNNWDSAFKYSSSDTLSYTSFS